MFPSRWERIPCTLQFRIIKIAIRQNSHDSFQLSWARGNSSGLTDQIMPRANREICFDHHFTCHCTMFISKADGKIRAKNMKFTLKRFGASNESRVFGKLTLNVAQFYNQPETIIHVEMESGRSEPPILHASFSFKQDNSPSETVMENLDDLSFIGETRDNRTALDSWDTTETASVVHRPQQSFPPPEIQQSALTEFHAKPTTHRRHVESSKPKPASLDGFMDRPPRLEIRTVLARSFPPLIESPMINDFFNYPPAVFPIVAGLLHSHCFTEENFPFADFCSEFFGALQSSPLSDSCTLEERFLTFLMIHLIVEKQDGIPARIQQFHVDMARATSDALIIFGKTLISRSDVIINRFATAKFDSESLLQDLCHVVFEIKDQLQYPSSLKRAVLRRLLGIIDAHFLERILKTPSRFTFTNAMTWSSFVTAFETQTNDTTFKLVRQLTALLMMAQTLPADMTLKSEVCPDLPIEVVAYVLKHTQDDEVMSKPAIDSAFLAKLGCDGESYGEVRPLEQAPFTKIDLDISQWNHVRIQESVIKDFPHFSEYLIN